MSYVSDLRVVLRGRNFRRLFATRLVSQFSDGIFQLAVGGYAFFSPERQASATAIAAGLAVLLLPYSVLGPFVGVFIDRWSRRQILVIAPVVRGVLLVLAACLVAAGPPTPSSTRRRSASSRSTASSCRPSARRCRTSCRPSTS